MSTRSTEPLTGDWGLTMLQRMAEAVFAVAPDGTIRLWNAAAEALFGVSADGVTPTLLAQLLGTVSLRRLLEGHGAPGEQLLRRHDGSALPARLDVTPLRDADGRLVLTACVVRDLSSARALAARAEQHQVISELAQGLLAGGPLEWILNEACQHLLEAAGAEQVGIWRAREGGASFELVAGAGWQPGTVGRSSPSDTDGAHLSAAFKEGVPAVLEQLLAEQRFELPPVLEQHEVRAGVAARIGAQRKAWGALAVYGGRAYGASDVQLVEAAANVLALALERTLAEEAVRRSELRLRELLEQVPDGLAVWNDSRQLLFANRAALQMLGAKDARFLEGQPLSEVLAPEVLEVASARANQCVETRAPLPPHDYRFADGRCIEAEAVPFEFGGGWAVLSIMREVTSRRQSEAQAMVADRLASVGLLAAGVAHELNNPLAWVLSNLRYLDEELAAGPGGANPELKEALDDAAGGAERMAVIIRDLKTFSRAEDETLEPICLERVVQAAQQMAGTQVRHRAKLTLNLASAPKVMGSEARMGQVLVNLLINASQAIPEGEAHRHEVEVSLCTSQEGWAELSVRDTGSGISAEHQARIFEPFFTTKPVGVGTGLGLTVCHGIVTRMGGSITVESQSGAGTTFRMRFPPAPNQSREADATQVSGTRRARVLVIDDEAPICTAFQRILGSQHEVHVRQSAEEALTLLDGGTAFDVIFCDVMMPGLGGPGFRNEVERRHPRLRDRVIYMTGGAFSPQGRALLDEVQDGALEKPFEPSQVRALVNAKVGEGGEP